MTAELEHADSSAWTPIELDAIREGLESAVLRLRAEVLLVHGEGLSPTAGGEILHDDLDVAAQRAELLQDAVQAQNLTVILEQTQHVLDRLSSGLYGTCEGCSGQIGRPRLEAFPRATLCMGCAH
jgi:DnaK suppressor protein